MRGSILVTFDEFVKDRDFDSWQISVTPGANSQRDHQYTDCTNLYSTYVFTGNTVNFTVTHDIGFLTNITIKRIDYTTDDEGGDNGIKEVNITPVILLQPTALIATFTASTVPSAYNFKYVISATTVPGPTPTPTPSPTPIPLDGQYILVGSQTPDRQNEKLLLSSNFGSSFSNISPPGISASLVSFDMTQNGSTIVAAYKDLLGPEDPLYLVRSTDYGSSWSSLTSAGLRKWKGVSISSDGTYIGAFEGSGSYYISNNSGSTFTTVGPVHYYVENFIPQNGYPQFAIIQPEFNQTEYPQKLSTSGSTFTDVTIVPAGEYADYKTSNNTANQILAQNYRTIGDDLDSKLYVSNNSGTTFTHVFTGSTNWIEMNVDLDTIAGSNMAVSYKPTITAVSQIVYSNNSGNTWATSSVSFTKNGSFTDIANSISGKYVYAPFLPSSYPIVDGNEIYYSTDSGTTFNNKITVTGITGFYINAIKTNK
jgi:hypothetical protein